MDPRVAVARAAGPYPLLPPFSPPERYPEFPHPENEEWDGDNRVYPAIRRLFRGLGLDAARYGTSAWNPLGNLVRPGDRVLLKPNYILHQHLSGRDPFAVVTHSAVVRAVIDYVHIALRGVGGITVADAPQANAEWAGILKVTRIDEVLAELKRRHGLEVTLLDLRELRVRQRHGLTVARETTSARSMVMDLGSRSALAGLGGSVRNLCGSDYDRRATVAGHHGGHRYAAALPVLECDVLISLAKLKVHKKTGVSLSLKNMVGINANKNFIPHYRVGDARSGGDEFPEEKSALGRARDRVARCLIDNLLGRVDRLAAPVIARLLGAFYRRAAGAPALDASDAGYNQAVIRLFYQRLLKKPVRAGNWAGNDTLWRAILDLNHIALYGNARGELLDRPARRYLALIDGVVAGEGEGPMDPDPVAAGLLFAGFNPVLTDIVATRFMGLDAGAIPLLQHALEDNLLAPPGVDPVIVADPGVEPDRGFRPPAGWPLMGPPVQPAIRLGTTNPGAPDATPERVTVT